jgi:hypothetical protein
MRNCRAATQAPAKNTDNTPIICKIDCHRDATTSGGGMAKAGEAAKSNAKHTRYLRSMIYPYPLNAAINTLTVLSA